VLCCIILTSVIADDSKPPSNTKIDDLETAEQHYPRPPYGNYGGYGGGKFKSRSKMI
jgi:hypothetical protein